MGRGGLPIETVGELVQSGEIPFSFLGAPFLSVEDVLSLTYAELSAEAGVDMETIQVLHEAIGFTRLTEERGDRTAAEMARSLEAIVERISHRYSGRPVRWLGDGGMFVFQDALAAVDAATAMLTEASKSNLPPTHIGIHCGPVIFQDGDIYGRTVNIASRLSSHATGGEILVSSALAERVGDERNFEPVGPIDLKRRR